MTQMERWVFGELCLEADHGTHRPVRYPFKMTQTERWVFGELYLERDHGMNHPVRMTQCSDMIATENPLYIKTKIIYLGDY